MDWLTPLVPVVASLVTLLIANNHSGRIAREARDAAATQDERRREFDARERRYEDRRDAIIALDAQARCEQDAISHFEYENQFPPGASIEDYDFRELNAAYARVVLLASPDVVEAADALRYAVMEQFEGEGTWQSTNEALMAYREAARKMLASGLA